MMLIGINYFHFDTNRIPMMLKYAQVFFQVSTGLMISWELDLWWSKG